MLKNYSKIEVNNFGAKNYLNDEGERHRLDGSAIEYPDGSKHWRINGNNHRNVNPADECSDGERFWFFKNERYRVGGSFCSKYEYWYINNKSYAKKQYYNIVWDI